MRDGDLIAFRRLNKVLNYRSGVALSPATAQRHLGTSTPLRREALDRLKLLAIPASEVILDRAGPAGPNWEGLCFQEVADIAPVPGVDNRCAARIDLRCRRLKGLTSNSLPVRSRLGDSPTEVTRRTPKPEKTDSAARCRRGLGPQKQ